MADEKDIIDSAMAADDFDYGDKEAPTVVDENADPNALEPEVASPDGDAPLQQTQTPEQSIKQVDPNLAAPHAAVADPNNPLNLKRVGAQFADGKGNIVDKTGKVIARAGESARHWQEASRANAQVSNLTRQLTHMSQQVESNKAIIAQAKEIAELPTKLGVSREDYNEGVTLMAQWRKDPVGVAREIVARTLTFGHNVSDILGKSAGDALEMKAISQLVNQSTAPMRQQQEQSARETEVREQAEQQYNTFTTQYPEAVHHEDAIANMMMKGVSPEVAFFKIKTFALENGLDFNQPLGPQIVAAQQRQPGQRPTVRTAPMPNGGRGNQSQMTTEPAMADASDDWGSILSTVMRATQ